MKEHVAEDQLTLHYYGDAENSAVVEQHLAECADCRAEFQTLQRVLNSMEALPVPERGESYGNEVWQRIAPRVKRSRWKLWFAPSRWAPVAAVAALVLAAFFAGRYSHHVGKTLTATSPAQVRERVLLVAVGDHLDRSQMMLVELANASTDGTVDLSGEKLRAENLIESNRLFRQTAAAAGEAGVESVLDDLERILLDVAHSPDTISGSDLQEIQKRIEEQGLLFKVRVVNSQIRERDSKPVATGSTRL